MAMFLTLLIPLVVAAFFFLGVLRMTVYRSCYSLPEVILFVRKLDVAELAKLLDPNEEWALRNLYSKKEFRRIQRERMRLAIEYLRRVGHNAEVIQTWATALHEKIKHKTDFNQQDILIYELVEQSTELRICNAVALAKVSFWLIFLSHLWPLRYVPRIPNLRRTGEVDVVGKYKTLIEISTSLSRTYGQRYYEDLVSAF